MPRTDWWRVIPLWRRVLYWGAWFGFICFIAFMLMALIYFIVQSIMQG